MHCRIVIALKAGHRVRPFRFKFGTMKKHIRLVLLSLAILTACGQGETARLDEKPNNSGYTSVFDSLNTLIKTDPSNADLYFERAKAHYVNRDLASALSDIGRSLKLDSSKAEYYLLLADMKLIEKESRASRDALQKAYKIAPNNVDVLLRLGELYMIVNDAEASFKYLNEVLKIDVYNARAYKLKGFNYKFLGDTAKAVSSFQTAVEQDPGDYDSYLQLALIYSTVGHEFALDYYNNALKVRPNSYEALYAKGLFLQSTNQPREAIEVYNEIIKLNPDYFDAWYNIGYVYLELLNQYDSAAIHFEKALETGPRGYKEARYNLGLSFEKAGDLKTAEAHYREALRIDPQYDLAANGLSRILD